LINDILIIDGRPETWEEALEYTFNALHEYGYVKKSFLSACIEREKKFPTGLPTKIGVAIPHTDAKHVITPAICVLRLGKPVLFQDMGDLDHSVKVHFVFNMALKDNNDQLPMLRSIISIVQNSRFLRRSKRKPADRLRKELMEIWCNAE